MTYDQMLQLEDLLRLWIKDHPDDQEPYETLLAVQHRMIEEGK